MEKVRALIIRACKSNNSGHRLKRIYQSIWYSEYNHRHMLDILSSIVEDYSLIRLSKLVQELKPSESWKYGGKESNSYEENACKCLISIIRLTEVSKLPDYPVPRKFRK